LDLHLDFVRVLSSAITILMVGGTRTAVWQLHRGIPCSGESSLTSIIRLVVVIVRSKGTLSVQIDGEK
jgi:hypothetical protein